VTAPAAGGRRAGVVALALALVLAFAASACTGEDNDRLRSSRTALENTTAKDFFVSLPDGEASLSLDGKLPPDWPSDFPLPSDAKPEGSGSIGGSSSTTQVAVYSTTQPADDVFDFYKNTQLDVSSPKSAGAGESFIGTLQFSGPFDGSLAVLAHDDKTFVVIVLHTNGS
jgi:hypothetical protein